MPPRLSFRLAWPIPRPEIELERGVRHKASLVDIKDNPTVFRPLPQMLRTLSFHIPRLSCGLLERFTGQQP